MHTDESARETQAQKFRRREGPPLVPLALSDKVSG